jgi:hypothetical protein
MAWTTPGTATAGQVLTAAFWNTNVRDNSVALPRGYIGLTTLATSFSTSSTSYVDVTGLSVTFTAEANRRYLVTLQYAMTNNSANVCQCVINDGTNDLSEGYSVQVSNVILSSHIFAVTTPAAGSVTYKVRIKVAGGTGEMYGSSTRASLASRLIVTDIGSTT